MNLSKVSPSVLRVIDLEIHLVRPEQTCGQFILTRKMCFPTCRGLEKKAKFV
jgi:hypothetical protein